MTIIGFVLLLVMHGSVVPVTDDIYTLEECESRAVQMTTVRNVELVCAEIIHVDRGEDENTGIASTGKDK